ncbi:MAG: dTDP-4-dehydrorhamnose 3,5-epimerase [Ilumatobacter sp.]|uniref:dTDP-4-dehydrorhamnose 3,5-epimerase family protein n=1 Tax=Ilumatobacter sp. TaxID=1967498 RepID=UPI00263523D6|nr:dTDP-4-dehydrorhamnose 3,5-epimerase [Ilumatobacter sp.]MDJ0768082.1 dTDP-4-dehydrorhamnose 3,5-epimerase [Ilumatobacter sp.]
MAVHVTEFDAHAGAIEGLVIATPKQVTDERGTIRELFRRSAFESAGISLAAFQQINVTESRRGAARGMHAESMTKLVTVAAGEVYAAFVDLRSASPTFATVESVTLVPGVQVLVPPGVANGFQSLSEVAQYVYCFDHEWSPGMPGRSVTPLDGELGIAWPLSIDPDDPAQISRKDRDAATLADLREAGA